MHTFSHYASLQGYRKVKGKYFFTAASQLPVKRIVKPESAIYDEVNMLNHTFSKFFSTEK